MGVERSVTRWYVQRQLIYDEVHLLEEQLEQATHPTIENGEDALSADPVDLVDIQQQLKKARKKLHLLGPCPKPIMG